MLWASFSDLNDYSSIFIFLPITWQFSIVLVTFCPDIFLWSEIDLVDFAENPFAALVPLLLSFDDGFGGSGGGWFNADFVVICKGYCFWASFYWSIYWSFDVHGDDIFCRTVVFVVAWVKFYYDYTFSLVDPGDATSSCGYEIYSYCMFSATFISSFFCKFRINSSALYCESRFIIWLSLLL